MHWRLGRPAHVEQAQMHLGLDQAQMHVGTVQAKMDVSMVEPHINLGLVQTEARTRAGLGPGSRDLF